MEGAVKTHPSSSFGGSYVAQFSLVGDVRAKDGVLGCRNWRAVARAPRAYLDGYCLRFRAPLRANIWCGRFCGASRAASTGDDMMSGTHRPTVLNGPRDAGAISYIASAPPSTASAHIFPPPCVLCAICHRLSAHHAATFVSPTSCDAVNAASRSSAGHLANVRSTVLRRTPRARGALRAGPIGARDPVRLPPRGSQAAG